MAWGYRAGSYADNGSSLSSATSGSTSAVTLGAAVSAGDLLVLALHFGTSASGGGIPTWTVSDSVNGAWSSGNGIEVTYTESGAGGVREGVWCFPNSAAGTPIITATVTSTSNTIGGGTSCAAFSGIATTSPIDTSASSTGTGSPTSTASGTEAASNELVVSAYGDFGHGTTLTKEAASTLAGEHQSDSNTLQSLVQYKNSSGTTDTSTITTGASTQWGMVEVVYKLSAAAPSQPPQEQMDTMAMAGTQCAMMR